MVTLGSRTLAVDGVRSEEAGVGLGDMLEAAEAEEVEETEEEEPDARRDGVEGCDAAWGCVAASRKRSCHCDVCVSQARSHAVCRCCCARTRDPYPRTLSTSEGELVEVAADEEDEDEEVEEKKNGLNTSSIREDSFGGDDEREDGDGDGALG
jgi:hypothetical protein